jgi:hypothetical protein
MSIPLNTDDWAGKYKGKTPANTDVDTFKNLVNQLQTGSDLRATPSVFKDLKKELDPTNEKRLKRLAEKREKTKRKNQVLRFVSLAVLVAGGYYLATQK